MLKPVFGNEVVEKVLFYLFIYERAYAKKIADTFAIPLNGVQQQLKRLETGGVLISRFYGRVRLYEFNPRYPFVKEIKALLEKAMQYLSEGEVSKYYMERTRPRRNGKPIWIKRKEKK